MKVFFGMFRSCRERVAWGWCRVEGRPRRWVCLNRRSSALFLALGYLSQDVFIKQRTITGNRRRNQSIKKQGTLGPSFFQQTHLSRYDLSRYKHAESMISQLMARWHEMEVPSHQLDRCLISLSLSKLLSLGSTRQRFSEIWIMVLVLGICCWLKGTDGWTHLSLAWTFSRGFLPFPPWTCKIWSRYFFIYAYLIFSFWLLKKFKEKKIIGDYGDRYSSR